MASYQRKMWSYHNTFGILPVERKLISAALSFLKERNTKTNLSMEYPANDSPRAQ